MPSYTLTIEGEARIEANEDPEEFVSAWFERLADQHHLEFDFPSSETSYQQEGENELRVYPLMIHYHDDFPSDEAAEAYTAFLAARLEASAPSLSENVASAKLVFQLRLGTAEDWDDPDEERALRTFMDVIANPAAGAAVQREVEED